MYTQIDVVLKWNDGDREPSFFIEEDGPLKWAYADVEGFDWKDEEEYDAALAKIAAEGKTPIVLFDGSDCINVTSLEAAIQPKKKGRK